jgi:hypothetical protein
MRHPKLSRLEEELARVPGVTGARVVGEDAPSEIHVVATAERPPKQIVRDVQSLCAASFGMPIDHRIVSIVRLDEHPEPAAAPVSIHPDGIRPAIERVVLATKGDTGWVKVALKWPDGTTTEGAGAAAPTREARARGAAGAVLKAIEQNLGAKGARVEVDHISVQKVESSESVLIHLFYYEGSMRTALLGSAIIQDDIATATVRAMLQALNRKLT